MKKILALTVFMTLALAQGAFAFLWFGKHEKKAPAATEITQAPPLTLAQAYQMALKKSETLAIQGEEIQKAQARFYKAMDYFLPTASFVMTRDYQDVDKGTSVSGSSLDVGRKLTPQDRFTFSQPLFSGFKELAALSASGADKKENRYRYQRAKELLFVDVMEAYYELLRLQKDTEILISVQRLLEERVKTLDERVRVGRSRQSEQSAARADLKMAAADLAGAIAAHTVAKNLLEFYIGESLGVRAMDDAPLNDVVAKTADPDQKVLRRSDVLASEQAYELAKKKMLGARGELVPTVSLDGNYYTKRIGSQSGNDWDVSVVFDVPIFEASTTLGEIKEAAANQNAAKLTWELSRRQAQLEAQEAYDGYLYGAFQSEALEAAALEARESYRLTVEDYGRNLVNHLEVLEMLRRYQEAERRYNNARYARKINYWKYKVALGDIAV